jgi:hypothetical protein
MRTKKRGPRRPYNVFPGKPHSINVRVGRQMFNALHRVATQRRQTISAIATREIAKSLKLKRRRRCCNQAQTVEAPGGQSGGLDS